MSTPDMSSLLVPPLVNVYVGPARKHWILHEKLLSHHSPFFASAFGGAFAEAETGKIELLEDDPAAFELLIQWLYSGSMGQKPTAATPKDEAWAFALLCFELWVLCDKFGITKLKNPAMDAYRHSCRQSDQIPSNGAMMQIYNRTSCGTPFQQLAADITAYEATCSDVDTDTANAFIDKHLEGPSLGTRYAADVVKAIRRSWRLSELKDPLSLTGCVYHVHAEGEVCEQMKAKSCCKHITGFRS
ncbi:MAG: hypothetical protein M1817_001033 [Caeruleum heppii]|nr:MAG: hypothetical protein M1817_001033 [Caeruleum heppii]